MGYETLVLDRAGAIATIAFNRPESRNAVDLAMRRELAAVLDDVENDPGVRVLVVTGRGGHFSAGGDVKSMRDHRHTAAEGRARVELLNRLVVRLAEFPRPTIAMVDGFAVGAGCNVAIACDIVVASDRARFGEVFARIGLVPDGGGSYFLPRLIGLARAKELVFTADIIDAAEAYRIGLVNRVVPAADLERETRALAERIAAGPPAALRLAKQVLNRSPQVDLRGALDLEASAQAIAITGDDHQEGLAAFFEKRAPRFSDR